MNSFSKSFGKFVKGKISKDHEIKMADDEYYLYDDESESSITEPFRDYNLGIKDEEYTGLPTPLSSSTPRRKDMGNHSRSNSARLSVHGISPTRDPNEILIDNLRNQQMRQQTERAGMANHRKQQVKKEKEKNNENIRYLPS